MYAYKEWQVEGERERDGEQDNPIFSPNLLFSIGYNNSPILPLCA